MADSKYHRKKIIHLREGDGQSLTDYARKQSSKINFSFNNQNASLLFHMRQMGQKDNIRAAFFCGKED